MLIQSFKSENKKIVLSFISGLLFIYIILFEFILPANRILPKPSILIESVPSLFQEYNFLSAIVFTFTAIYSIMFISYFLIKMTSSLLIIFAKYYPGLVEIFNIGKYFIPLFLIILFDLWFGTSIWGEYLFILIIIMGTLKSKLLQSYSNVKKEYLTSAQSLGLTESEIIKKIIWKSIQPEIFKTFLLGNISIWSLVIIYEYVCKTDGVGLILNLALKYNDLSLVIVLIIFLILMFLVMELLLSRIKKKYFFWE